jgi:NADPH:quinone reductase-like Zn-dependent oxidoreductase
MKAIAHERYGAPDVLELREVDTPPIEDHQVLVRVHATSVNPVEWYSVTGPWFARLLGGGIRRPKTVTVGADLAGRVEAVGRDVTELQPGDEVFGTSGASWAEFAPARDARLAPKPSRLSFEEAAAVPIAAITALQALRDHGKVQPDDKVLVNGASGGVGTFTVQIAKALGAEVTGVCSTRNMELVRSLGADHVVDYTKEDFTRSGARYDVIVDIAGSRSFSELRRVMNPAARVVIVGAKMSGHGLGPLGHIIRMRLASLGRSQKAVFFFAKITKEDLVVLQKLLDSGKVVPVIDRRYEGLERTPEALRYLGEGHARGKVVIAV